MKYFALIGVLAVLVMTGTAAARPDGNNDGALSVRHADRRVIVVGEGVVIGRLDRGQVTIKDPNPYDAAVPIVTEPRRRRASARDDPLQRHEPSLPDDRRRVHRQRLRNRRRHVGRRPGNGQLNGAIARGNTDHADATYAVNGDPPLPFPTYTLTFPLAPNAPGG